MKTIEEQLVEAKEYCEADRDTLVAELEAVCGNKATPDIEDRIWQLEHQIAVWDAAERTWTEKEIEESNFGSFDDLISQEL
jgi:hypothetical protein